MLVTVTHLKTTWPPGAVVGDVIDLPGDTLPAWAVGKCQPAAEGAAATLTFGAATGDGSGVAAGPLSEGEQIGAALASAVQQHEQEVADAQARAEAAPAARKKAGKA